MNFLSKIQYTLGCWMTDFGLWLANKGLVITERISPTDMQIVQVMHVDGYPDFDDDFDDQEIPVPEIKPYLH